VRRVPGGQRQSVFAYPHEIDAWLSSHGQNGAAHAETSPAEGLDSSAHGASVDAAVAPGPEFQRKAAHAPHELAPRFNKWNLAVASAVLLALGLSAGFMLTRSRTSAPMLPISKQLTDDGRP